jgi:hypothetical protein
MKKIYFTLLILLMIGQVRAANMWVFFDLGNTVINIKNKNSLDYFQGSENYIKSLRKMGIKVGVITNIPETFGKDYNEKLHTLKKYIRDSWVGSRPFDWSLFDKVYLPLNNSELKPAPILYRRAVEFINNSPRLFISETQKELDEAINQGFAVHLYKEQDSDLYIPLDIIKEYILTNSNGFYN